MSEKYKIFKYPVLRGLGVLGQAMSLGIKALRFSANAALDDGSAERKPKEISSWGHDASDPVLVRVLHFPL